MKCSYRRLLVKRGIGNIKVIAYRALVKKNSLTCNNSQILYDKGYKSQKLISESWIYECLYSF